MKDLFLKCVPLLLVCLWSASASGCAKDSTGTHVMTTTVQGKTFLALGDSYTIGESVSASDRFPAQTAALLKTKGIETAIPEYIAITGWTTIDLRNAIQAASLKQSYDIVTLLIGVNDQYQGLDTAGYRTRFKQLLEKAISLTGGKANHVFVLSIPDYSATPFGNGSAKIHREITTFNAINRQVTDDYKIAYIDITPISLKSATDNAYTAADGLHPSAKQYSEWAAILAASIADHLIVVR